MNPMRSIGAALLLATSSIACGNILGSASNPSASILGGEAMQLRLAKTTVTEGDVLDLTVTLTNTGDAPVTFEGNTCPWSVFEVQDAAGERIDPRIELILCAAYTKIERLTPGQSFSWSLQWRAARYGPSRVVRAPGAQTVKIRARYWVDGRREVAGGWQNVTVNQAP